MYVASHVQFIPTAVWRQYFDVVNLNASYQHVLDMHGINVIVLSKELHNDAIKQLQRDGQNNGTWQTEYEDNRAVILIRRNPI